MTDPQELREAVAKLADAISELYLNEWMRAGRDNLQALQQHYSKKRDELARITQSLRGETQETDR